MLLISRSIVYSQTTSNDSIKCFTYSEAKQIITDLRKLPVKDSIINRLDSIVKISDTIILKHEYKITEQRLSIQLKDAEIIKVKRRKKFLFIFGGLLGLCTQLIF